MAARVGDDQWDDPSPCDEWTAREVVGHVTWGTLAVATQAADEEPPAAAPEREVAGDDPDASFAATGDGPRIGLRHGAAAAQ